MKATTDANRNDLGLVGRTLAAIQQLGHIVEIRKCSPQSALGELTSSEILDARVLRAMAEAFTPARLTQVG